MSSAGVDREVTDTFRLVVRAGRQDCGVNNTDGDDNQGKTGKRGIHRENLGYSSVISIKVVGVRLPR